MDLADFIRGAAQLYAGYTQGEVQGTQEAQSKADKLFQQEVQAQEAARLQGKTLADIGLAGAEQGRVAAEEALTQARVPQVEAQTQGQHIDNRTAAQDLAWREDERPYLDLQRAFNMRNLEGAMPFAEQQGALRTRADIAESTSTIERTPAETEAAIAEAGSKAQKAEFDEDTYRYMVDAGIPERMAEVQEAQSTFQIMESTLGKERAAMALRHMPMEDQLRVAEMRKSIIDVEEKFNTREADLYEAAALHGWDGERVAEEAIDIPDVDVGKVLRALQTQRAIDRVVRRANETGKAHFAAGMGIEMPTGEVVNLRSQRTIDEQQLADEQARSAMNAQDAAVQQGWAGLANEADRINKTYRLGIGNLSLNQKQFEFAMTQGVADILHSLTPEGVVRNPGALHGIIDRLSGTGAINQETADALHTRADMKPSEALKIVEELSKASRAGSDSGGGGGSPFGAIGQWGSFYR